MTIQFVAAFVVSAVIMCAASAKEIRGEAEASILESYSSCDQPSDELCKAGQPCHVNLQVRGEPAKTLLKVLKDRAVTDEALREEHKQLLELGLSVYTSKDGNLTCDDTEGQELSCAFSLNIPTASLEPIPICE